MIDSVNIILTEIINFEFIYHSSSKKKYILENSKYDFYLTHTNKTCSSTHNSSTLYTQNNNTYIKNTYKIYHVSITSLMSYT